MGPPGKQIKLSNKQRKNKRKTLHLPAESSGEESPPLLTESSHEIFAKRQRMNRKISALSSIKLIWSNFNTNIDIVLDSE